MKVGFIGLGIMGRPMAGHVIRGGYPLHIYSRGTPPPELIEAGAIGCGSAREVAERSDAVITMVPDTPDVEAVVFGANGIAEGLRPGKIVIDMSSISPIATKKFAKPASREGLRLAGRPGFRRRRRCPERNALHHGGRRRSGVRAGQADPGADGQEHHPGRRRPATGRPRKSPIRSSWRSQSRRWPRRCCSHPRPAPIRRGCVRR